MFRNMCENFKIDYKKRTKGVIDKVAELGVAGGRIIYPIDLSPFF